MGWWTDNIFTDQFWNRYIIRDDKASSTHVSGKGILQRYTELWGKWLDNETLPLIDNAVDNLVNVDTMLPQFIPYMERQLGVDLVLSDDIVMRRLVMKNFLALTNIKGSKRGFESAIRLMRFSGLVIDTVEIIPYYDVPLPSPPRDCNTCWEFDVVITGSLVFIDYEVVVAIFAVVEWNRPIKWITRFVEYNCHQLSLELILFYLEDFFGGSSDLFAIYDNIPPPTIPLVTLDVEGNLIIDGVADAIYYELDDIYFFNEGNVIFRRPSSYACPVFESYHPIDGSITTDGFTLTWDLPVDMPTEYTVIVGTEMVDDANIIIDNRLIDTVVPVPTLAYIVTGAQDDTWYASQVTSDCDDPDDRDCVGYSPIRWTKTRKILSAPINLALIEQGSNHLAIAWDAVVGASGYRWDVATDAAFTSLIHDDVIVQYGGTMAVATLPSSGTYYFRVKAIHHITETFMPVIESQSNDSTTVIVIIP